MDNHQQNLENTHVKLLAFHLLSLTPIQNSSKPCSFSFPFPFSRKSSSPHISLSRVEILGIITSRHHKPDKYIQFTIDDGTACVTCLLWLNHLNSPYFSRRCPSDVRLFSQLANTFASLVNVGFVARVRGRITPYRGALQITVSDVVIERDPNAEILHCLDCLRLARLFYHAPTPPPPSSDLST